ncbi:hypothetical protein D9758_010961 [Tetrapyrgos nigripes]|uniref:Uncharacterized protein n=1 Tax=Tetrapyrgos nigripes TaxID=182062 RepID=A0A8H5LPR0_9AGAR|nr:hypothetical protein D9758_010961 [Tetrapyrgos nigripes]
MVFVDCLTTITFNIMTRSNGVGPRVLIKATTLQFERNKSLKSFKDTLWSKRWDFLQPPGAYGDIDDVSLEFHGQILDCSDSDKTCLDSGIKEGDSVDAVYHISSDDDSDDGSTGSGGADADAGDSGYHNFSHIKYSIPVSGHASGCGRILNYAHSTTRMASDVNIVYDKEMIAYSLDSYLEVNVLHGWDGDMKHPKVKGRSLEKGGSFQIPYDYDSVGDWICENAAKEQRYFPSNYVEVKPINPDETNLGVKGPVVLKSSGSTPQLSLPRLPKFCYPKAKELDFEVKFADQGHSFLNVSLSYDEWSSPEELIIVQVKIYCTTGDAFRRISAVSLKISIPETEITAIYPEEKNGAMDLPTEFTTSEKETGAYGFQKLAINLPGGGGAEFEGGGNKGQENELSQKGTMHSRSTMQGSVLGRSSVVHWSIKEAAANEKVGYGITGKQGEMGFVLKGKPDRFEYDCAVMHVKNGKEDVKRKASRAWIQRLFRN